MTALAPRLTTLVLELTYRCPLRCAYCSNPTTILQRAEPLATRDWLQAIDEAERLGALHVHFTGGEPLSFADLEVLVGRAHERGLYTNLVTSAVPLTRARLVELERAGLEHVQISFQAATAERSRRIAGVDARDQKLRAARWVKELGMALTVNLVLHRQNLSELPQMLALAESLEPHRIELANAQYLGWALLNRERLLPSVEQLDEARRVATAARDRLRGKTDVLFVLPDYYAGRPRACMQGWGRSYLVITPDGLLLPCQAARDLPDLRFDDVRSAPLTELWHHSAALGRFRGEAWYPDPCRSCERRAEDFGGCRCQAFRLTGNLEATDPACSFAPAHQLVRAARARASMLDTSAPLELRRAPRQRSAG